MPQLAPATDGIRLTLHILAASVWVGGQITLAGLLPTARSLGGGATAALARAFARLQWPSYAVLVATGIWNVTALGSSHQHAWKVTLGVKVAVVVIAGLAAYLHTRAKAPAALAAWGATAAISSLAALALGVFLAG